MLCCSHKVSLSRFKAGVRVYIKRGFEYPCSFTGSDGPFLSTNSDAELAAYGVSAQGSSTRFQPKRIVFSETFIVGNDHGTEFGAGYYVQ
jgi:hypothetical protein